MESKTTEDIRYHNAMDQIYIQAREVAKLKRQLKRDGKDYAAIEEAIRAYYAQHRVTLCKPGTEFVVNADRTVEVK